MTRDHPGGRAWQATIRRITNSGQATCWICGHPGARTVDHVVPRSKWPRLPNGQLAPGCDADDNLRPAHGTRAQYLTNRCATCGRLCNQSRGNKTERARHSRVW